MTEEMPKMPMRTIWLDPHCADCFDRTAFSEFSWCDAPVQEHCSVCDRGPIPYNIDRRFLRKSER